MKIGITIITYERPEKLLRLVLDRIFRLSGNVSVVIVSNSESEDAKNREESLQKEFPFTLLRNKSLFVLTARNKGTLHQFDSCDYFVEMDDDMIVTPGWLERIITVMEKDEAIGIAVPLLNFSQVIWYKGQVVALPPEINKNLEAIALEKDYNTDLLDSFWQRIFASKNSTYQEIKAAPEISLQVKSKKAIEAGCLWDENLDGACVEVNAVLARRIREAGMKVVVVKNSFVFHLQTSTHAATMRQGDLGGKLHGDNCQYIAEKFGSMENIYDFKIPEEVEVFTLNWELYQKHSEDNLRD